MRRFMLALLALVFCGFAAPAFAGCTPTGNTSGTDTAAIVANTYGACQGSGGAATTATLQSAAVRYWQRHGPDRDRLFKRHGYSELLRLFRGHDGQLSGKPGRHELCFDLVQPGGHAVYLPEHHAFRRHDVAMSSCWTDQAARHCQWIFGRNGHGDGYRRSRALESQSR
jgi:hypothetical protein